MEKGRHQQDFVDIISKNSWREAADRDSITLGIGNWKTAANDRTSYRRQLWELMDHN